MQVSKYLRSQIPDSAKQDNNMDEDKLVEEIFQHEDIDKVNIKWLNGFNQ